MAVTHRGLGEDEVMTKGINCALFQAGWCRIREPTRSTRFAALLTEFEKNVACFASSLKTPMVFNPSSIAAYALHTRKMDSLISVQLMRKDFLRDGKPLLPKLQK